VYDSDGELPHDGVRAFFFDYTNWGKPGRDAEGSLATVLYTPVLYTPVLYTPEGAALKRLPWPDALAARARYRPLAVASFTRELILPVVEGLIIERAGCAWESINGRNALPEAERLQIAY
jgi:hypothetical protein